MGKFKNISTLYGWVIIVFGALLLAACAQNSNPTPDLTATFTLEPSPSTTNTPTFTFSTTTPTTSSTPSPIPESSPIATQPPEPMFSIKAMTYNIRHGAGISDMYKEGAYPDIEKSNIPAMLHIVRHANPDILGLQELQHWDKGDPSVIEQVSKELDMEYFLTTEKDTGWPVGIFTRLPILEAEDISHLTTEHGALRTRLMGPDGQIINVFVVHFSGRNVLASSFEVKIFLQWIEKYTHNERSSGELHILMGDMNFSPYKEPARYLENAGWVMVANTSISNIDQIWVLDSVDWSRKQLLRLENMPALNKSDHNPLAFEISVFSFHEIPQYTPFPPTPTQIADPSP